MGGRKEEMTPDFLNGLFVHDVRRLESEIKNIHGEPQRVTRATARLRLNYEQDVLPPPTAEENVTDSTMVPTVGYSIDLTTDEVVDKPCSPPDRQIISVGPSQRVDLTAVVSPKVPHQLDQYSCGIHIIQMLAGAGMKGLGLDQCWRVKKLAWIATIDQVTTMGIMLSGWLNGKFKHVP
ncbi:hypothetical protein R1flu_007432 [Riccia fluitans]|uniref:Ubiquitin-like protease family profile domain-containing protein n=1 Tax=Riccia fluitans TaxID=41844 RepID=A0ABD1YZ18_9MARC